MEGHWGLVWLVWLVVFVPGRVCEDAPEDANVTATDAPSGKSEETQTIIAVMIIVGLSIFGIALYYLYSRREKQKRRAADSHHLDNPYRNDAEAYPNPAPSPPLPLQEQSPAPLTDLTNTESLITSPLLPESTRGSNRNSLEKRSLSTRGTPVLGSSLGGVYQVGDAVIGKKGSERARGRIVADNRDGTYTLQYEDGDFDTKAEAGSLYAVGLYQMGDMVTHLPSSSPCFVTGYGATPGSYVLTLLPEFSGMKVAEQSLKHVAEGQLQPRQASFHLPVSTSAASPGGYGVGSKVAARASPNSPAKQGVIRAVKAEEGSPTYTVVFTNGDVASQVDGGAILPLAHDNAGGGNGVAPVASSSIAKEPSKRTLAKSFSEPRGSFARSMGGMSDTSALQTLAGLHSVATTPITPKTRQFPRSSTGRQSFNV